METLADVPKAKTEAKSLTGMRRKRIRSRFRATLAGLLELEVLRVKHKEMVEMALGKCEKPDHLVNLELQQGQRHYWMEESSFRLKLKRSRSQENVLDTQEIKTFPNLIKAGHSSEDLQQLYCPNKPSSTFDDRRSRASSGFCGSEFGGISNGSGDDTISSLSTSMASLSYKGAASDAGYSGHEDSVQWRPVREDNARKSGMDAFSEEVIPESGFLSVVDLYPDSHWPDISDILQPQVVLEPSYRSDLKSHQGSEVYRYPSPLHAVALQSPLYAPRSPTKYRKGYRRCSLGDSTLNSSSLLRPGSPSVQRGFDVCCHSESASLLQSSTSLHWLQSGLTGKQAHSENCKCVEIILKRVQGQHWCHTTAKNGGIQSFSRRSMASLHRTCSMGKSRVPATVKPKYFQSRSTGASASELAGPIAPEQTGFRGHLGMQKNRLRRHTAALTNLNIFRESNSTSIPCGVFLDRRCSVRSSEERNVLFHGLFMPDK